MTPAVLAIVYWLVKIAGAVALAIAALWVKLRHDDRKAMRATPSGPPVMGATAEGERFFARRPSPAFAPTDIEEVAFLDHVIDDIRTGDLFLFMGTAIHSYINRIADWSRFSHAMMARRDSHGKVWVAEVVERTKLGWRGWRPTADLGGFREVPLTDYVKDHPGQVYWSKVAHEYDKPALFNRERVAEAIRASEKWSYGWSGIGLNLLTKMPFVRIVTYLLTWRNIDRAWDGRPPFCSWAVSIWATVAGQDPTPCLAPQLTTPACIERSKLWGKKVALVP